MIAVVAAGVVTAVPSISHCSIRFFFPGISIRVGHLRVSVFFARMGMGCPRGINNPISLVDQSFSLVQCCE